MKALRRTARCALALGLSNLACTGTAGSPGGDSCARWEGVWEGHEIGPSGEDLGPVRVESRDDWAKVEVEGRYAEPESLELSGTCNETVTPKTKP